MVIKVNVYFDGKVVSYLVFFVDGSKKMFGLIYVGLYYFGIDVVECMEIVVGSCKVMLDG